MNLTVEVFSDVICPWCFIGKRRLETAIAVLGTAHHVQVRWLPFQLNPEMPSEDIRRLDYRINKFGSLERSMELDANIVAVGKEEDIQFAFDRMGRTPNTLDAHRLISLADQHHIQDQVVEGLFRAYFTEGRDISNRETLIDVVAKAGLHRSFAESLLNGDEGFDEIRAATERSRQIGISGVPFFIVNGEMMFSGAQPPDTFLAAFHHVIASE
jgi:predicted DsbA family dithiol-disulfide isomerase